MKSPNELNNFFNIKKYFKLCKLNYEIDSFIMAICTERNTGKSTSILKFLLNEYEEKGHKFFILRTTGEQLKKFRESFNSSFNGKYWMSLNKIYKLIPKVDDKSGEPIEDKFKREEMGSLGQLTTESNYKSSGGYEGYKYIFWDEFNDLNLIPNLYDNFANLIKTIQRFKKEFIILMAGNKDTANNPFLVNWGIEVEPDDGNDKVYILDPAGNNSAKIFYIDVSKKTFENLNQTHGLANLMASYSPKMNRYMNLGGYRELGEKNIINFYLKIAPTSKPKWYILTRKNKFEFGEFLNNKNEKSIYLRQIIDENELLNLPTFMLGLQNGINEKAAIQIDNDDENNLVEMIFNYAKRGLLYYSSYETKILIDAWLHIILQTFN